MNLFIAVVFFCTPESCYFWKSPSNYYKKEECIKAANNFSKLLEDKQIASYSTCFVVNTRNEINGI